MKLSWFEFARHEAGKKMTSLCRSCRLSPLQHRNEPTSASCAPACVLCAHMKGLIPLHVPATCPLVCADLNNRMVKYPWRSSRTCPSGCTIASHGLNNFGFLTLSYLHRSFWLFSFDLARILVRKKITILPLSFPRAFSVVYFDDELSLKTVARSAHMH